MILNNLKDKEFCPHCEDYRDTEIITKDEAYTVRGQDIVVPIIVPSCCTCGKQIISDEDDQKIVDAICAEYRKQNKRK